VDAQLVRSCMVHFAGMEPVDLWVKAGSDGARLGGDPLCHQIFMILIEKSLHPESGLKFNVKTVNEAKPPPEFRQAGLRHAPALQHGEDFAYSHPDEIIEYIDRTFPLPSLKSDSAGAGDATANLFRAFAFFIKEVSTDPKALETELTRLDHYLSEIDTKFLAADRLTHIDCYILPKLHTIRIAAAALKQYEIPASLHNLWAYMKRGYETDAFRKSCPCDQEIILYWADRPDTPNLSSQKRSQLYRQKTTCTLTVPSETENGARENGEN
uniref:Chloride intracellular channel n=1 Tax=Parascaris univalens TaxID=6257 RepID=A0A915AX27_PARUN